MDFFDSRIADDAIGSTLRICRNCSSLTGHCTLSGTSYHQKCQCERDAEDLWRGFDFNEVFTLCYGCGVELLRSGSRWSVWFCDPCKRSVSSLNEVCQSYVIPIGRHSMMGLGGNRELSLKCDQLDVALFVRGMKELGDRFNRLTAHARRSVEGNCNAGRLDSQKPSLNQYLTAVQGDVHLRSLRMCQLLDCFEVPRSLAKQITSRDTK